MFMPAISIIIPAKNEERCLPSLLSSIAAQADVACEVIVADAHSDDQTVPLAAAGGARVVEGGMPGVGRNRGAAGAQGDLFLFLDADVQLMSPRFLADCIAEMKRKNLDVATCCLKPLSSRLLDRVMHDACNRYGVAMQNIKPYITGCCIFVRRSVHEALGGFDESVVFAEDQDYVRRARRHGYHFGVLEAHPVGISVRRFEKDGYARTVFKYLLTDIRMSIKGPFRKGELPFAYHMGGERLHVSSEKVRSKNEPHA